MHFNPKLLSADGSVSSIKTQEGMDARNSLHNRVVADAFVPAGGRPETIGESNWSNYLTPEGKPSSKVIVEGANLYLTPSAREHLFAQSGLPIVKDSTANKCGVVCSSYEFMSAMLMDREEFVSNKKSIVEDVQTKLKELARVEAELLFREYDADPSSPLPSLGIRIINAIIKTSDAIYNELENEDLSSSK